MPQNFPATLADDMTQWCLDNSGNYFRIEFRKKYKIIAIVLHMETNNNSDQLKSFSTSLKIEYGLTNRDWIILPSKVNLHMI